MPTASVTRVGFASRFEGKPGTKMMPHKHPEDRIYTVMSGVFYIGLGDVFNESKLTAFAPGSVVVLPGGQTHFHWAKSGEYIAQVAAIGPLGLSHVDLGDDPPRSAHGWCTRDDRRRLQLRCFDLRVRKPILMLG